MIFSFIWLLAVLLLFGYVLCGRFSLKSMVMGFAPLSLSLVFLSITPVPLSWLIVLALGALLAAARYFFYADAEEKKNIAPRMPNIKEDRYVIAALVIALATFLLMYQGAMGYPYLENDDPWLHALGTNKVAYTQSASQQVAPSMAEFERWYIEPYPPAFDILMGLLRQLNDSTYATLKLFNAILIGAAVLAFYYWAAGFFGKGKEWVAVAACFFIACLPAFMSHFIWAQTLAMLLVFCSLCSLGSLLKVQGKRDEREGMAVAAICFAAVLVSQPSVAVTFGAIAGVYFAVHAVLERKVAVRLLSALVIGGILACALYWVPTYVKFGTEQFMAGIGFSSSFLTGGTSDDTSGGIVYTLDDFLFPPTASKIDQQVGIGIGIVLLCICALAFIVKDAIGKKFEAGAIFLALLLVFGVLGVQGNALPFKLFPHRFWVFLAVPAAALAAYACARVAQSLNMKFLASHHGIASIKEGGKVEGEGKDIDAIAHVKHEHECVKFKGKYKGYEEEFVAKRKGEGMEVFTSPVWLKALFALAVLALVVNFSLVPRVAVQTAIWPPGGWWMGNDHVVGFLELQRLPQNAKVFPLCSEADDKISGFDMISERWKPEYAQFEKIAFNKTPDSVADFLKLNGYEYSIIDIGCLKKTYITTSTLEAKLNEYGKSGRYSIVGQNGVVFIFKVN